MNMKLFGLVSICGVLAIACGDSGSGGSSSGGGGSDTGGSSNNGAGTSNGGSTNIGAGTANGGSGTGGAPLECDTGVPGDLSAMDGTPEAQTCSDCIDCALGGNCADEIAVFQNDPNAPAWVACVFGDMNAMPPTMGCPADDPATANTDEFQVCLDACNAATPGVMDEYLAALGCAVCVECPTNCNAAANCM